MAEAQPSKPVSSDSRIRKAFRAQAKALLGLGLWAGLLAGCGDPATDLEHLARAKEARDQGDLRTSVIELKSALQKNPDNAEARRLLGEASLKLGNGAAAEKELKRALGLGVAREAVMLALAEALQLQGKHQAILDEIDVPPSLPPEAQATLAAYRGDAWLALGKPDQARREYEQSLSLDPASPRGKLGLAYLAAAENKIDQAVEFIDEAVRTDPHEARLWSFKATLHQRRGELENAEAAYTRAIDNRRRNELDRVNRALVRIELKQFDEAAKDIDVLKKTAPKLHLTHLAEGYLKVAQGRFSEAREPLERAIRLNDRFPLSYFYLGLVNLSQNELEQADHNLTRYKSLQPDSGRAHKMLALVKFRQKDYPAAKQLLLPVILSYPDDVHALNLMAAIEFASGDPAEGLSYLQRVSELRPDSTAAKVHLGMGKLLAGVKEEGIKSLQSLIRADPSLIQPEIVLANLFIQDRDFNQARAVIERLKSKLPDDPQPLMLEAKMLAARGDTDQSKALLEQVLAASPGDPDAAINLARIAMRDGTPDRARQLYEEVLQAHPGHLAANLGLAEVDLAQGRFEAAEKRLAKVVQEYPKTLQPRLLLARLYLRLGQSDRSLTLLNEVRHLHPAHPELLELMLEAQLAANLPKPALATARKLEQAAPASAQAQYLIANAYALNGDSRHMRAALDRALDSDPGFLPARLTLVKLLLDQDKKPGRARQELERLVSEHPQHPEVLELQGWWALRHQQPLQAARHFRAAFIARPSSGLVRDLAGALWQADRPEDAATILEHWTARFPQDTAARYLLASLYKSLGREQETVAILTGILEVTPRNPRVLNDLAWLLRTRDPKRALEYAEQALAAAPKAPPVLDTLAMVLLENRQPARALALLEQAAALAPQNPSLRYHLAVARLANGQRQKAVSGLASLLKSGAPFQERQEAEALLERLGGRGTQP